MDVWLSEGVLSHPYLLTQLLPNTAVVYHNEIGNRRKAHDIENRRKAHKNKPQVVIA